MYGDFLCINIQKNVIMKFKPFLVRKSSNFIKHIISVLSPEKHLRVCRFGREGLQNFSMH